MTAPPTKTWFKNTPENVAEFMRRWPDVKYTFDTGIEQIASNKNATGIAVKDDGRLDWCMTPSFFTSMGYTPLDLTTKLPDKVWFKNTPENVAEFNRRYPSSGLNAFIAHVTEVRKYVISEIGFHGDSFGHVSQDSSGWYTRNGYTELDLAPAKPEVKAAEAVDPHAAIIELAKKCKDCQYGGSECADLSRSLADAGFPFLSKAVLGGEAWVRDIVNCKSLKEIEENASNPWYTEQGCKEFKFSEPTTQGTKWLVASAEKPKLTNCCFENTKENVAEFMRRYPDVRSCMGRTAEELHNDFVTNSSHLVIDDGGTLCVNHGKTCSRPVLDLKVRESIADLGAKWSDMHASTSPMAPALDELRRINTTLKANAFAPASFFTGPFSLWYPSLVSSVSKKEDDMSPSEIQTVIDAVTRNLSAKSLTAATSAKPNILSRATGYTWGATKSTFGWVFAPVKKITQLTACIVALSGIFYGGYKAYDAIANMQLPSITWEQPAEASPSDVVGN
jgi:hypothetical protein